MFTMGRAHIDRFPFKRHLKQYYYAKIINKDNFILYCFKLIIHLEKI